MYVPPEAGEVDDDDDLIITKDDIEDALQDTRKSVSDEVRKRYEAIYANSVGEQSSNFSLDFREGDSATQMSKTVGTRVAQR